MPDAPAHPSTCDAQLRDSLSKNTRLAGSSLLPELPGRSLFASSAAELVLRQRSFSSLLDYLGLNEELAAADATCAFFSGACSLAGKSFHLANRTLADVPAPNLHAVHLESVGEARAVLTIDTWALQYSKNGIEIAVHALPTSNLHLIKTKLTVPLSVERTHAHYTVRGQVAHACMLCAVGTRSLTSGLAAHSELGALHP